MIARHSPLRGNLRNKHVALAAILASLASGFTFALFSAGAAVAQEAVAPNATVTAERRVIIRFVTESEFPPFNFYDEDGVLTGFNIDLARAICLEVNVTCDIKVQPWNKLVPTLKRGEADAIIAAQSVTAKSLHDVDFTARYFHTPGRFVARHRGRKIDISREALVDRLIGVAAGTAHEAYIKTFFGDARIKTFKTPDKTREALREGQVDVIFGDGISLAFWLNGTLSQQCCEFRGGPFLEPKFFGDGLAIAVRSGDNRLRSEINEGLERVRSSGRFRELVARYFPFEIY